MSKKINQLFHKYLKEVSLMDDIFMSECFNGSNDCIEYIIRVVIGRDDLVVVSSEVQKVLKGPRREVRLDVIATDKYGRIYNIEIQNADSGAVPERARYNLSMIDVNNLEEGEDFSALPDVYVIFFTKHDVLGYNLPLYTIERRIKENSKLFNDRTTLFYVNCEAQNLNTELGRLVHDLACSKADDIYSETLAKRVKYFKEDRQEVMELGEIFEKYAKEYAQKHVQKYAKEYAQKHMQEYAKEYAQEYGNTRYAEGRAEGRISQVKEFAGKMLQAGKFSLSEIVQYTGLTMYAVRKLAKQLKEGK